MPAFRIWSGAGCPHGLFSALEDARRATRLGQAKPQPVAQFEQNQSGDRQQDEDHSQSAQPDRFVGPRAAVERDIVAAVGTAHRVFVDFGVAGRTGEKRRVGGIAGFVVIFIVVDIRSAHCEPRRTEKQKYGNRSTLHRMADRRPFDKFQPGHGGLR